jgi:hypothetical protein
VARATGRCRLWRIFQKSDGPVFRGNTIDSKNQRMALISSKPEEL